MGLSDPPLRFGFNTHAQPKLTAESKCESFFFSKLLFIICKRFFLKDLFVFATGIFFIIKWTHKLSFFHFRVLSRTSFSLILTISFLWAAHFMSSQKTRKEYRVPKSEFRITITNFQTNSNFCIVSRYLFPLEQFDYLKLFVKIRNWYLVKKTSYEFWILSLKFALWRPYAWIYCLANLHTIHSQRQMIDFCTYSQTWN